MSQHVVFRDRYLYPGLDSAWTRSFRFPVLIPKHFPSSQAMMEADRDREMVDVIVKKIEAEERAEQEQYLKSR